jgi:hypothetical protein
MAQQSGSCVEEIEAAQLCRGQCENFEKAGRRGEA